MQIIKQPNGKFSLWSGGIDDFVVIDATKEEIIQEFVDDAIEQAKENVLKVFEKIEAGNKPYFQFTKTYEECLEIIVERERDEDE